MASHARMAFSARSAVSVTLLSACAFAQEPRLASGGALIPTQACYDVQAYTLTLSVDPKAKAIEGSLAMVATIVAPTESITLDLDRRLAVARVELDGKPVEFTHAAGRIDVPCARKTSDEITVVVAYGGQPRVAPRAPWDGGFTWAKTRAGEPWIATTCQGEGADLWWPCKDHPSDKPARVDLHITVPAGLVCASNGRLQGIVAGRGGSRTFHWRVRVPIANYSIALNIAPYEVIEATFQSVAGDEVPVAFYVLPENLAQATKALPEFLDHVHHMEEVCGPYPFRAEKYGIVETPHLGMEHQTIIAYGNEYRKTSFDYDWLHHHEMCHEWWANLVTCRDWSDMWIHEGIGTYMQALYIESRRGHAQYLVEMNTKRRTLGNRRAVAPREVQDSKEIYFGGSGGNDIYYKGSCVMHTLRWLAGDEKFFVALRRLAYPDPKLEAVRDGSCVRFEDTEGVRRILEQHTGRDLAWFFEVYLRQPALPILHAVKTAAGLDLRWEVPGDLPFPMPVPVVIDGKVQRVEMLDGRASVPVSPGTEAVVDPDNWVLRRAERG